MQLFEQLESEVRGYCRSWPTVFSSAEGWTLVGEDGRRYLDFFAGAGALNYGHNHPVMTERLIAYLQSNGIVHGLDMATTAKRDLLATFDEIVLRPRDLSYKLQFPGPTGTNAVEAALKLARRYTGRDRVIGFTNGFHGMTLGSLAVTGNSMKRRGAGIALQNADSMPYDGFLGPDVDTIDYLDAFLAGGGSGVDLPAAVVVETTQGEGGLNQASPDWLRRLAVVCKDHEILLIADDIQVGCGRTGTFFSWEGMGFEPDIVCLSKSLSGAGLPMSLTLLKPELDVWEPGEHNGTFRGNNAAFITATAALELFWSDDALTKEVHRKSELMRAGLESIAADHPRLVTDVRGPGMIQGLELAIPDAAGAVTTAAFERGLIIETAGPEDEVVKLLPPLIVDDGAIAQALAIVASSLEEVCAGLDPSALDALEVVA